MKELPTYYYLDNFLEFLSFIEQSCQHLLNTSHREWLGNFHLLSKDAQCLLVRVVSRKHRLIKRASLDYDEINDIVFHYQTLLELGWIGNIRTDDLADSLPQLTKTELYRLLINSNCAQARQSMNKASLLALANEQATFSALTMSGVAESYCVRRVDHVIQYFLLLFFGHSHGSLTQFSMRDLGLRKTRKDSQQSTAHFESLADAESAFFFAQLRNAVKASNQTQFPQDWLENLPNVSGTLAQRYHDEVLWRVGKATLAVDRAFALACFQRSGKDAAQEKWVREMYSDGAHQLVEQHLLAMIEQPQSEELLVFAQDFLARKYQQKRTSPMTDWLRNTDSVLNIDAIYLNSVERGVVDFYQRKNVTAFRTENTLWLSFFGLIFWDIIYEKAPDSLKNEFDTRPKVLLENRLYQDYAALIEKRLAHMTSPSECMAILAKHVALHHNKINHLFQWHEGILDPIKHLLENTNLRHCTEILRAMSIDFGSLRDGFPDIMVIDQDGLRFEEVKAPGDALRRNQLVTLNKLKQCGFDVRVTRVEWCHDPMQPYAVVDIETTGGRANNHRITEIGIVKRINGETVAQWQHLINPQRHIPAAITRLTGIDNEMVVDAPIFAEIADELEAFTEGCIFVAHNVNFDYGFIRQEYARLGRHYRRPKLCTCAGMRKTKPGLKSYSLANLTAHFGIEMTRHHRAMSDAVAAADLLDIILAER